MSKSKYETHVLPNLEKITSWAKQGATSKDIAAKLKVSYSTFRSYIAMGEDGDGRYTALSEAFAQACEVPDETIETALFNRAKGIEYEEKTFERVLNKTSGKFEEVCTKRVTKFIPPDPTSAMFWLTNRRPDRWSYKPQPGEDDDDENSGVVMLAPVMERPEPPEGGGKDA